MKNNSNTQQVIQFQEHSANIKFRGYVQRVAFQVTLSEPMIRALQVIRDYPAYSNNKTNKDLIKEHKQTEIRSLSNQAQCVWIVEISALERRGLAYHNPAPKNNPWPENWVFYKLTRAGELMCELLIEAGLMEDFEN